MDSNIPYEFTYMFGPHSEDAGADLQSSLSDPSTAPTANFGGHSLPENKATAAAGRALQLPIPTDAPEFSFNFNSVSLAQGTNTGATSTSGQLLPNNNTNINNNNSYFPPAATTHASHQLMANGGYISSSSSSNNNQLPPHGGMALPLDSSSSHQAAVIGDAGYGGQGLPWQQHTTGNDGLMTQTQTQTHTVDRKCCKPPLCKAPSPNLTLTDTSISFLVTTPHHQQSLSVPQFQPHHVQPQAPTTSFSNSHLHQHSQHTQSNSKLAFGNYQDSSFGQDQVALPSSLPFSTIDSPQYTAAIASAAYYAPNQINTPLTQFQQPQQQPQQQPLQFNLQHQVYQQPELSTVDTLPTQVSIPEEPSIPTNPKKRSLAVADQDNHNSSSTSNASHRLKKFKFLYSDLSDSSRAIFESKPLSEQIRLKFQVVFLMYAQIGSVAELVDRFSRLILEVDISDEDDVGDPDAFSIAFGVALDNDSDLFWTGMRSQSLVITRCRTWLAKMYKAQQWDKTATILRGLLKMSLTQSHLETFKLAKLLKGIIKKGAGNSAGFAAEKVLQRADELAELNSRNYAASGTNDSNGTDPTALSLRSMPTIQGPTAQQTLALSSSTGVLPAPATAAPRPLPIAKKSSALPPPNSTPAPSSAYSITATAARTSKSPTPPLQTSASPTPLQEQQSKAALLPIEPITSTSRKRARADVGSGTSSSSATSGTTTTTRKRASSKDIKRTTLTSAINLSKSKPVVPSTRPLANFTIPRRSAGSATSTSTMSSTAGSTSAASVGRQRPSVSATADSTSTTAESSPASKPAAPSTNGTLGSSFFKSLKSHRATTPTATPTPKPTPSAPTLSSPTKDTDSTIASISALPSGFSFSSHLKTLRNPGKRTEGKEEEKESLPRKRRKTVQWKDDSELVHVKEFYLDPEEIASKRPALGAKALDYNEAKAAFGNSKNAHNRNEEIEWHTPMQYTVSPEMEGQINDVPLKRGGNRAVESPEAETQKKAEEQRLIALYINDAQIPDSPNESFLKKNEEADSSETKIIPLSSELMDHPALRMSPGEPRSNMGSNSGAGMNGSTGITLSNSNNEPPNSQYNANNGGNSNNFPATSSVPNPDLAAISSLLEGLKKTVGNPPSLAMGVPGVQGGTQGTMNQMSLPPQMPVPMPMPMPMDQNSQNPAAFLSQLSTMMNTNNNNFNSFNPNMNFNFNNMNDNSNDDGQYGNFNKKNKNRLRRANQTLTPTHLKLRSKDVRPFVRNDQTTMDKWKFPCHFFKDHCDNGDSCTYLHIPPE